MAKPHTSAKLAQSNDENQTEFFKRVYLSGGLHQWLSNYGTVYYSNDFAEGDTDFSNMFTTTHGDFSPNVVVEFDDGEVVMLSTLRGASWRDAKAKLEQLWSLGNAASEPVSVGLNDGEAYVDGFLTVSPYSEFGSLFSQDTHEVEALPSEEVWEDARALLMLYQSQMVQWAKEMVREAVSDWKNPQSIGLDYVGVLVAQTTGSSRTPVAKVDEVSSKSLDWSQGVMHLGM